MKESKVEKDCVAYAEACGGEMFKWTSPGRAGVLDRILVLPGLPVVFVELKRASGGVVSELQWETYYRLIEIGHHAWIIKDLDDFVQRILRLRHAHGKSDTPRPTGSD